jgi:Domain of Unknown Function (DUF1080)
MKKMITLLQLLFFVVPIWAQKTSAFEPFNRSITSFQEKGKKGAIRFNEAPGSGGAWLNGKAFSTGTIEFDVRGRDSFQRSFVGVAFHGVDNETYEAIYFRPFNFQATDSVRHIHAVQYIFEPQFTWKVLRDTRNAVFEAKISPASIQATDWFHARVEVKNDRIRVFVNDAKVPCLDVPSLNPGTKSGKIGLWVGDNSNGDFANFRFSKK